MTPSKYKHLFFDLDRTLWDFETNATETFTEIHGKYTLAQKGITTLDEFMEVYEKINLKLWDDYRKGQIKKEVLNVKRFALTLDNFGIEDDSLSESIARDYVELSPTKKNLFPYTISILEYLHTKYSLHIITNGFEEVQHKKVKNSNLEKYFTHVITSEDAGYKKPDINIFQYAFDISGAKPEESLMIGDDIEVDIEGARIAGMDQVLVDYKNEFIGSNATYRITSLAELYEIL
jgi:putative hydrolase of the HAD superfamily